MGEDCCCCCFLDTICIDGSIIGVFVLHAKELRTTTCKADDLALTQTYNSF